jgi:enterobactin synthetase component D
MLVARTNPGVVGVPASTFSVTFAVEDFSEAAAADLGIAVPDSLHRAVLKRKAEYVAGRFCARQAMRAVRPDGDSDLGTLPDRRPAWPAGIVGSLTHTAGFASAAICGAQFARGIGIDSERIMSDDAMRCIRDVVISAHDSLPHGTADDAIWATLAFSAKESVFKCFYPLVRKMFWFETVRMEILDIHRQTFRATLLVDLGRELRSGTTVEGRYQIEPPFVHTGVLLAA